MKLLNICKHSSKSISNKIKFLDDKMNIVTNLFIGKVLSVMLISLNTDGLASP